MKIFISSTYEDLIDERNSAISTIDRNDQSIAMEKWFAEAEAPKEVALNKLQECDAVVLILGFRYGSIDKEEGISITEIEYNAAKSLGIPVFVFLKSNSEGKWVNEEKDDIVYKKHNAFKIRIDSEIEKNYRKKFKTSQELATEIIGAIRQYEIENGMIGSRISVFVSYEEFSKPFLNKNKIFNHSYSFVGRNNFLNDLDHFINSDNKVAVIYGRGGIGKSKILLEFARNFENNHHNWKIRFLKESIPLLEESVRQLPAKKCVIIVDDAHRRGDIGFLLNLLHQYPDRAKIVISCRSHGLNSINTALSITGFDPSEVYNIPEVKELEISDLRKLGNEVLGSDHQQFLEPLIHVAKDSTLVLVVGGRLIAKNLINPNLLERNHEFNKVVFDKFQEVLTGNINDKLDEELCKEILSIISALSPIYTQNGEFQESVSNFLNIDKSKLIEAIGILEESGILLRRGYSLRITPDVLSDHILYRACIAFNGQSTGYAKRIFDEFWSSLPANILFNLSELDWRTMKEDTSINLLREIWSVIENDFKTGSHLERVEILKYMDKVAYLQPAKVLELIEFAINNPCKDSDDAKIPFKYQCTHQNVLGMLPSLLKQIAHNFDYLPRCCDILWLLGRNEKYRPPNFGPAMSALSYLAGYEINKQFIYNSKVLDIVENWFKDPNVDEYFNSPLDVIDPLFKKEGDTPRMEGPKLILDHFTVPYEETKPIRDKALFLISESAKLNSTKVNLRVLKSLIAALRPPPGYYGREVQDDELNQWLPEQLKILEIIENLVNIEDSIVRIQIASDLKWYSTYTLQKDIAIKASSILNLIPDSFDLQITKAIWNNYREYRSRKDQLELIKKDKKDVISELLKNINNEMDLFSFLNQILNNFQNSRIQIHPEEFLEMLSIENCEMSAKLCKLIISNPSCPLAAYIGSLLSGIKEINKSNTIDLIKLSLDTESETIYYSIAYNYNNRRLGFPIGNDEINLIENLIDSTDKNVKKQAIESLRRFSDEDKAIQLALNIEIGDDEKLADSLCLVFDTRLGISPDKMVNGDLETILSKFITINKLDDYLDHLDRFIGYCSSRIPEVIIDFLLKRLEISKEKAGFWNEYEALPFRFEYGLKISSSPNYINILRKVRDNVLNPEINKILLSKIFMEISDGFSASGIEVLNEWIESGDREKIEAVSLLIRDAPVDFLFSNSEFISKLIEKSYMIKEDCYENVTDDCFQIINPIDLSRTSGDLPLEVVKIRDHSEEVSRKFMKGSPTEKFYSYLKEYANDTIRRELAKDEEKYDV